MMITFNLNIPLSSWLQKGASHEPHWNRIENAFYSNFSYILENNINVIVSPLSAALL